MNPEMSIATKARSVLKKLLQKALSHENIRFHKTILCVTPVFSCLRGSKTKQ